MGVDLNMLSYFNDSASVWGENQTEDAESIFPSYNGWIMVYNHSNNVAPMFILAVGHKFSIKNSMKCLIEVQI